MRDVCEGKIDSHEVHNVMVLPGGIAKSQDFRKMS
jgi:hypothetical protein